MISNTYMWGLTWFVSFWQMRRKKNDKRDSERAGKGKCVTISRLLLFLSCLFSLLVLSRLPVMKRRWKNMIMFIVYFNMNSLRRERKKEVMKSENNRHSCTFRLDIRLGCFIHRKKYFSIILFIFIHVSMCGNRPRGKTLINIFFFSSNRKTRISSILSFMYFNLLRRKTIRKWLFFFVFFFSCSFRI